MMHLVHTFSMSQPLLSLSRPSAFAQLGIGVELYFHQLFSLGIVFLLMGLINLSNLLTNLSYWTGDTARQSAAAAGGGSDGAKRDAADWLGALQETVLIGMASRCAHTSPP